MGSESGEPIQRWHARPATRRSYFGFPLGVAGFLDLDDESLTWRPLVGPSERWPLQELRCRVGTILGVLIVEGEPATRFSVDDEPLDEVVLRQDSPRRAEAARAIVRAVRDR